jgi:phenylacetate-CoA ligase
MDSQTESVAGHEPTSTADHYDPLERRRPEVRELALFGALREHLAYATAHAPAYATLFSGIDPRDITSREALARIPVTRKSELKGLQARARPLGGFNARPLETFAKLFVSPGPIYEVEGHGPNWWRTARALHAAGFRRGDIMANTFAYHLTPAGSMFEAGAIACGCVVVPTGVGQTEIQVSAMADLGVNAYVGTPSFLGLLVDKADELKVNLSCLQKAVVSGEYLAPALRARLAERGLSVMQSYATADFGLIAYESRAPGGAVCDGMVVDEGVLLEIVAPGTSDPVAEGEVGEVVVTNFNRDYPLIRFALGDLSAVLQGPSPCGRTNTRIRGWLGRADQSVKVRGMFVHPSQVGDILRRHPEIKRARLIVDAVDGHDRMTLHCEAEPAAPELAEAIVATVREITKLRGGVNVVSPGALPEDGRVIEDARKYE